MLEDEINANVFLCLLKEIQHDKDWYSRLSDNNNERKVMLLSKDCGRQAPWVKCVKGCGTSPRKVFEFQFQYQIQTL